MKTKPFLPHDEFDRRATSPFALLALLCLLCLSASAPRVHALDGAIVSWGDNSVGQVSGTPVGTFSGVAAGDRHNVAIRMDGTLVSWGYDSYGQVSGTPAGTFTGVAAGGLHSVAIRTGGTLVSWGYDGAGQVSGTPILGTFSAVAAGYEHSVALRTDGTLVSWGSDGSGQVSGTPAGTFSAVGGGTVFGVALRTDGTLVSWGNDGYGEVSGTPAGTFSAFGAGSRHSVAIRTDGTLASWGYDAYGQVSGTPSGTFSAVAAGSLHSVAIVHDVCVPPVIVSQPQSVTIDGCLPNPLPGGILTLTVVATGTALQYQWESSPNGSIFTPVAGGNNPSYTLIPGGNHLWFRVRVFNACGAELSAVAEYSFIPASTPPALLSVQMDCANNTVCLQFNKAVVGSDPPPANALDPSNYSLDGANDFASVAFGANQSIVCLSLDPSSLPLLPGVHTLDIVQVQDFCGNISFLSFPVTVAANARPAIAGCPANISVQSGPGGTCNQVANWTPPTATDDCAVASFTSTHSPGSSFPVGMTPVTYTATDFSGNISSCSFTVTVTDTTPPVLHCSVPSVFPEPFSYLWPVNNKLINVGLAVSATDCSPVTTEVRVYSNEPNGPPPHSPDATYLGGILKLRAQRDPNDPNGRIYLIVVKATDSGGNSTFSTTTVGLPRINNPVQRLHVHNMGVLANNDFMAVSPPTWNWSTPTPFTLPFILAAGPKSVTFYRIL